METYSGSNDSVSKDVGRPIIVYDDSSKQNNKDATSSTSEIRISKVRRLPGRDISISSSEDEDYDDDDIPKVIEIIEDPAKKINPRKSSMVVNGATRATSASGVKQLDIDSTFNKSDKSLTTSSSANELSKGIRFEGLASPVDIKPIRKRSVSFLPTSAEKCTDGKSSSNPNSKMGSVDLTRNESLQEDAEEEEIRGMSHLQVSVSENARERRRSIENLCRPPTPPNACHSVKQ